MSLRGSHVRIMLRRGSGLIVVLHFLAGEGTRRALYLQECLRQLGGTTELWVFYQGAVFPCWSVGTFVSFYIHFSVARLLCVKGLGSKVHMDIVLQCDLLCLSVFVGVSETRVCVFPSAPSTSPLHGTQ